MCETASQVESVVCVFSVQCSVFSDGNARTSTCQWYRFSPCLVGNSKDMPILKIPTEQNSMLAVDKFKFKVPIENTTKCQKDPEAKSVFQHTTTVVSCIHHSSISYTLQQY